MGAMAFAGNAIAPMGRSYRTRGVACDKPRAAANHVHDGHNRPTDHDDGWKPAPP
jgi:hypothetical protein